MPQAMLLFGTHLAVVLNFSNMEYIFCQHNSASRELPAGSYEFYQVSTLQGAGILLKRSNPRYYQGITIRILFSPRRNLCRNILSKHFEVDLHTAESLKLL